MKQFAITSPSKIRALYAGTEMNIRKKWGQNFFTEISFLRSVLRKTAQKYTLIPETVNHDKSSLSGYDHSRPRIKQKVMEIGPGLGALTQAWLDEFEQQTQSMYLLEKDPFLAETLRQNLSEKDLVQLVTGDILNPPGSIEAWLNQEDGQSGTILIGNLPYYITSPILEWFISQKHFVQGFFIIQKDVAEKFISEKMSQRITAYLRLRSRIYYLKTIPNILFFPKPRVASAAVYIVKDTGPVDHKIRNLMSEKEHGPNEKKIFEIRETLLHTSLCVLQALYWGKRKGLFSVLTKNPHQPVDPDFARMVIEQSGFEQNVRADQFTFDEMLRFLFYFTLNQKRIKKD